MTTANRMAVVVGLALAVASPSARAQDAEEEERAAALAAEPRQAFWGREPGRPELETDRYRMAVPRLPLRLDGMFWADTGYMEQANTQVGTFDKDVNYAQGQFVLGAAYRHDLGAFFGEARVQFVGFENEFTRSQYEPHTQDAFVRFGHRRWDVQVGRFLEWEPYYRGNGIERFTAEENGALGGPAMYRLDYALGWKDEPGQAALHLYPADWAALEVSSVYGQENEQNTRGVRPTLALRRWGFLLVGGWEHFTRRPQSESNKVEQTATGFAGRLQYTFLGTTLGVNAARATVDATRIDGLVDAQESFDKTSIGAFLQWDVGSSVVGAGYHLTTRDNEQGERDRHHQTFLSYVHRLPVRGFSVKAVLGFARAELEDVDARSEWENDMTSFRVRAQYEF